MAPIPHKVRAWFTSHHRLVLIHWNSVTKMAIMEVVCINSDKVSKLLTVALLLHKSINTLFSQLEKSDQNWSFSRIYQRERPFPKQCKSFFHSLFLNSRASFTIVMLFESFLWCNRHNYSLIKHGAFDWSLQFLVSWYIQSIPDPSFIRRGGCHQASLMLRVWFYNVYVMQLM